MAMRLKMACGLGSRLVSVHKIPPNRHHPKSSRSHFNRLTIAFTVFLTHHALPLLLLLLQLDDSCNLQPEVAGSTHTDPGSIPVTGMLRLIAALALFLEGLAGVYIPVLLRSVEGYEWWVLPLIGQITMAAFSRVQWMLCNLCEGLHMCLLIKWISSKALKTPVPLGPPSPALCLCLCLLNPLCLFPPHPVPILLSIYRWLSLLNCFSGGVFLAAGLVHLLPHCQESQERLGHLVGDYPLYLVLITLGYMLVLFVERVLFDVHGSAHGHGPHTGAWMGGRGGARVFRVDVLRVNLRRRAMQLDVTVTRRGGSTKSTRKGWRGDGGCGGGSEGGMGLLGAVMPPGQHSNNIMQHMACSQDRRH